MNIRNSVKALVIKEDKILVTKNKDDDGFFYLCPGGGQEHGETFHETLQRECMEEIGHEVQVIGDLLFVRELIGKKYGRPSVHQVEYYFPCTLIYEEMEFKLATNPDNHQIGVEWLPINELMHYRFYPQEMRNYIISHLNGEETPIYLGNMN